MAPRITRMIRLDTPGAARKFVRPIASRIAWELEAENAGQIREGGANVTYRRGTSIRTGHGLFASFDPGEFVVEANGRTIAIRYSLGLGPALFVAALLPLASPTRSTCRASLAPCSSYSPASRQHSAPGSPSICGRSAAG
jgi:hypothetical protein